MIQNHATGKKNRDGARKKFDRRKHDMELWDIYDENKQPTGRTMRRNDWHMKPGEFHLTVLGVIARPDGTFLITKRVMTKAWAPAGGRFPAARHRQERAPGRPCAVRSERKPDSM